MLRVIGFDHVVLRVRDLDRALGFYRDVLGLRIELLEEYRKGLRPCVSARAGEQLIDLVPDPTYDPKEGSSKGGLLHVCLEIDGKLAAILPWLRERGVNVIEDQPMARMGARGMGLAVYVSDPDGYIVELKERSP
jgi:catechol 2,3-dioxygenase-like lactoylglutathione lyase family enzyme